MQTGWTGQRISRGHEPKFGSRPAIGTAWGRKRLRFNSLSMVLSVPLDRVRTVERI